MIKAFKSKHKPLCNYLDDSHKWQELACEHILQSIGHCLHDIDVLS